MKASDVEEVLISGEALVALVEEFRWALEEDPPVLIPAVCATALATYRAAHAEQQLSPVEAAASFVLALVSGHSDGNLGERLPNGLFGLRLALPEDWVNIDRERYLLVTERMLDEAKSKGATLVRATLMLELAKRVLQFGGMSSRDARAMLVRVLVRMVGREDAGQVLGMVEERLFEEYPAKAKA